MDRQLLDEIASQPAGWQQALDLTREAREKLTELVAHRHTRFLGAGSSFYLGNTAASVWADLGLSASSVPASEPLLHPRRYPWGPEHVALAVSRSGTTTETLTALTRAKAAGSVTIAVTTVQGSPMANIADLTLVVSHGAESATVQTRSFSSQLMTVLAAAAQVREPALLELLAQWLPDASLLVSRSEAAVKNLDTAWDRAYFLGTGTLIGIAQEGALKLKESALTEAEAFQTLEFRHGPKSMVDDRTLVVGLLSKEAEGQELRVMREMHEIGAQLLLIGEAPPANLAKATVAIGGATPAALSAPLYLPTLHYLAYHRAKSKGISPAHPRNLTFAVELEGL